MSLLIFGSTALLLAALERLSALRFRAGRLFRRYFMTDVVYLLTGFVAGGSLAIAYVQAGSEWVETSLHFPRLWAFDLPLWATVVITLLLLDFGNYLAHYFLHRSDWLWEFHKIHHSSEHLDWLATFRSHLVEQAFRRLLAPILLIVVGVPIQAVLIGSGIFISWGMLNHSNLKVNLRFLEPVLITPRLHRVHHVYRTSERNLGTILTIWDRIRGTFVLAGVDEKSVFGIGEKTYPQSWGRQLVEPFLRITSIGNAYGPKTER